MTVSDNSAKVHFQFFDLVQPVLDAHPVFGLGLNTFSVYYEFLTGKTNWGPHSFYIALLDETGLVGAVVFAAFLAWVGHAPGGDPARLARAAAARRRGGRRLARRSASGSRAALAATLVANVFYLTMQFYYFYGLVLIVAAASALAVERVAPARMTDVSVVIVSYESRALLERCLAALAADARAARRRIEAIVVDQASRDGTAAWLAAEHPEVRLVALPENVGFGAGNNRGAARRDRALAAAAQQRRLRAPGRDRRARALRRGAARPQAPSGPGCSGPTGACSARAGASRPSSASPPSTSTCASSRRTRGSSTASTAASSPTTRRVASTGSRAPACSCAASCSSGSAASTRRSSSTPRRSTCSTAPRSSARRPGTTRPPRSSTCGAARPDARSALTLQEQARSHVRYLGKHASRGRGAARAHRAAGGPRACAPRARAPTARPPAGWPRRPVEALLGGGRPRVAARWTEPLPWPGARPQGDLLGVARSPSSGRTRSTRSSSPRWRGSGRARRARTRLPAARRARDRRLQRGRRDRGQARERARARLPAPSSCASSWPRMPRATAPTRSCGASPSAASSWCARRAGARSTPRTRRAHARRRRRGRVLGRQLPVAAGCARDSSSRRSPMRASPTSAGGCSCARPRARTRRAPTGATRSGCGRASRSCTP